jgi:hypothetical protein
LNSNIFFYESLMISYESTGTVKILNISIYQHRVEVALKVAARPLKNVAAPPSLQHQAALLSCLVPINFQSCPYCGRMKKSNLQA